MNQQAPFSPRAHYFYVAIAKYLFYHPEHGIVSVQDPIKIKDAEQYGLSPLILYGLTVSGVPIRWMTFSPANQPRAFRDILLEGWRSAKGLRGRPDILVVNRHLAQASPKLARDLANIGVHVEIACAKEKSLPAFLRSAQNFSKFFLGEYDSKDPSITESIQALCRVAQYDHDFLISGGRKGLNSREVEERIQKWLALPAQGPVTTLTDGLDWEPGPWLSSWESSLPPNPPRYFNFDGFDGKTWLVTGEKTPEDIDENDDFGVESYYDNAAEIARNLVACWPNPPAKIAKCAGITLRELQWFTSGKAPLDRPKRFELENLLSLEYNEHMGCYEGAGPYVLMAHKAKALKELYETISKGGNAYPYEIVPRQGAADPSWRYVIINTFGEPPSILMSPRGAKITELLPDLLLNFAGIKHISPEFYRDVVSTCARACRKPEANLREMKDFVKRCEEQGIDFG